MNRFQILKNHDVVARSASMSLEDFQRKIEDQKRKKQEERAQRLSPQQQLHNEEIRHQLSTLEGRSTLANHIASSVQRRVDFSSVARRAFQVQPLPSGSIPVYERRSIPVYERRSIPVYERIENYPVFTGNTEGLVESQPILPMYPPRYPSVQVPIFEISSHPEISLSQIRDQRFDLIDRVQGIAAADISNRESLISSNILNAAITNTNQIIRPPSGSLLNIFSDAFSILERSGLRAGNIFLNPSEYLDIRNHLGNSLDESRQRELISHGLIGSLWGAQLIVNQNISPGEIFVTSEPEQLGVMPIRSDITALSADDPSRVTIGWSIFENVGMACLNPSAVVRISPERNIMEQPVVGESMIQRAMPELLKLRSRFELLKQENQV